LFGYSIPIELPPGRAGMQPALSVGYMSTEVETALGVGFAMSGLSAITRCQRTVAQDGERRDVDLTPDDRLCLDGARLVLLSGAYGAVNARYTTEEDELVLVEAYGSASALSFRVRLPNGRERQYGSTLDSRLWVTAPISEEIVTETWYLAQEVDPQGNTVDYEYQQEAGADSTIRNDVRINRIEYTGNVGSGAASRRGARAVQFIYSETSRHPPVGDCLTPPADPGVSTSAFCSDSSPPSTAYARGIGAYRPSRRPLERLVISVKGEVVAEYRFRGSDAPGSHLYRLDEIEHCVRAPATSADDADETEPAMVCTPPTHFNWRDRAVVPRPNTADGEADPRYHLPTFERRDISWDRAELRGSFRCGTDDETGAPLYCSYPNPTLAFDVNGDGADDVAYRSDGTAPGASEGDLVVRLGLPIPRATANWPSGALPYEHTIVPAIRSEIPEFVDLVEGIRHGALAIERPVALDWNADGLDDLLIEFGTVDEVRFLVLESERGPPETPVSFVLRDTTLREPREQIFFNDFPAVESGIASWEVLDMDGDGRQDIAACVIDVGCVQRSFSWDARFTACPAHWAVALRDDGGWGAFQHSNVVTECSFENGRGRVQLYDFESGSDPSPYTGRVVSGDFNGDGRQELIIAANYFDGGFRRMLRWSGSELVAEEMSSLPRFGVLTVADVNGDGMHDVTAVLSISHSYGADVNRPPPRDAWSTWKGRGLEAMIAPPDGRRERALVPSSSIRTLRFRCQRADACTYEATA